MNVEETKNLIAIFVTGDFSNLSLPNDDLRLLLLNISPESIITIIKSNSDRLVSITPGNIPQFSNIDLLPRVIEVVRNATDLSSYADVGAYLTTLGAKEGAKQKYGENHYKLAVQLGLAVPTSKHFALTHLGEMYYGETDFDNKLLIAKKLSLRIPVIQQGIILAEEGTFDIGNFLLNYLSPSTIDRRRSNINTLFAWVNSIASMQTQHILNNIVWR